jgi:anti-sigma factor RsiW
MNELLPGYAAGSLADADRDRVRAHLAGCARCRADLAAWRAIAAAAPSADQRAPEPVQLVRTVLTRSALGERPSEPGPGSRPLRHLRYLAALVLAEARLIRLAVPVASALVMALGVTFVLIRAATEEPGTSTAAGDLLALVAPIVAAAGVAGAYRSRHDPAAELVAATPTSGRFLLLVRLTLVFGYDLVLALAASAVLAVTAADTTSLDMLIGAWLGPMALLSSLSLLVAVRFGPDVALGTAVGLWALRVFADGVVEHDGWPTRLIVEVWSTNAVVLGMSVALAIAAVVAAGRSGPFAGEPNQRRRATHPM